MNLFTTVLGLGLVILLLDVRAEALPDASDFKEVGEETQEAAAEEVEKTKLGENEKILSGTVRVIRKIELTEVFFKDLNDSYFIPSGRAYSSIYKALEESMKKGTSVSFKANTKSRRVLSLESAPEPVPAKAGDIKSAPSPQGAK